MSRQDIIKVSAPGKIHLMGEHSVVYGKPALLAAIDKRCFVELTKRDDKKIVLIANNTTDFVTITEKEILAKDKKISKQFDYVILILQQTLRYYEKHFPSGFSLVINNQIPEGLGLGSSAALAVAIAGAVTIFLKEDFDKEKINAIAFLAEQFAHGTPSGGDNSTSAFGGFVWFRKETDNLKIIEQISLELSDEMKNSFFLLDTGKPEETTGEMVGLVKKFFDQNPKKAKRIFDDQEGLARQLLPALQNNSEEVSEIIKRGEKNLEAMGVVSPSVKKTIRAIEKAGGAAKVCGGGGRTKGTGMLLVYSPNREIFEHVAAQENLMYNMVELGEKGIQLE